MKVKELYEHIDSMYPRSLSCEWDNDGVMCCADGEAEITKVLISLDATFFAVQEAARRGCNVLLTHHPLLFKKPSSICLDEYLGKRVIESVRSGVSVLSFHTRLDAGTGGVNDCLVNALGFTAAGSFGGDDQPCLGRYFDVPEGIDAEELARLCKSKLGSEVVKINGHGKGKRVCVVGGSGSDLLRAAIDMGGDILVTGECSYNAAQDAFEKGLIVIEAGHYETEAPVCKRFAEICSALGLLYEVFDSRIYGVI